MATNSKNLTVPNDNFASLGENVSYVVVDGHLILKVDLGYRNDVGNAATIRVATTRGNKQVPDTDVVVGLNAYEYRVKK